MRENSNHEEMVECHYQGSIIYVPVRTFIEVTMKMRLERKRFVRYKEGAKHYSKMVLVDTVKVDEFLLLC